MGEWMGLHAGAVAASYSARTSEALAGLCPLPLPAPVSCPGTLPPRGAAPERPPAKARGVKGR